MSRPARFCFIPPRKKWRFMGTTWPRASTVLLRPLMFSDVRGREDGRSEPFSTGKSRKRAQLPLDSRHIQKVVGHGKTTSVGYPCFAAAKALTSSKEKPPLFRNKDRGGFSCFKRSPAPPSILSMALALSEETCNPYPNTPSTRHT